MTNFFSALNGAPELNQVSMFHLTGNTSATAADQYGLLALSGQADYGNIHAYPSGQPHGQLLAGLGTSYFSVLPSRAVITEIGYSTLGTGAFTQRAQALLTLNTFLSAFQQGFKRTFIYELTDNSFEGHGLYATNDSPKQAATVMHNFTTILADGANPIPYPGVLNSTITGMPPRGFSVLLQKSNGLFYLILWNEAVVWENGHDVDVAPSSLTVNFGTLRKRVRVFNPFVGTSPTQTRNNVSAINLSLGAEPLILEIQI